MTVGNINIATLLGFLPVVGPVVAAMPEFAALWNEAAATFGPSDQKTLKRAYEAAISGADDAHSNLQAIVAAHSGLGPS